MMVLKSHGSHPVLWNMPNRAGQAICNTGTSGSQRMLKGSLNLISYVIGPYLHKQQAAAAV